MKFKDLTNERFGRLVAICRIENNKFGHPVWRCLCDCGKEANISSSNLRGNSSSCGCYQRDRAREARRLRPYEALYRTIERNSIHPVELTYEQFLTFVQHTHCHYCKIPVDWMMFGNDKARRGYNLDRKDSTKGYSMDNCVTCCKRCNWGKGDQFTYVQWVEIGKLIQTWSK